MAHRAISQALEDMDAEAFLRALQVATIEALDPASRPRFSMVMKVLDALNIKLHVTVQPVSSARYVADIGSKGRLTLPRALMEESGWTSGDTLLFEEDEGGQMRLRKVVRVRSASTQDG